MTPNPLRAALLALALSAGASIAHAEGRLVQVDVVDRDSGDALHVYRDHGRPVVAGRPGARYGLRVVNRSDERVMVVVAIDGVDILTGETAATAQDGYVLDPHQRALLTGWRKTHSEVAAFEFTRLSSSYAARTGRPDDVGVIGVASFREKTAVVVAPPPPPVAWTPSVKSEAGPAPDQRPLPAPSPLAREKRSSMADAAVAAAAPTPAPEERLGTGHGRRETSWVTDTTFDRLTPAPQEVIRIRYDSLPNLVAAGIVPRPRPLARDDTPRAYPGDPEPGFVPDPPLR